MDMGGVCAQNVLKLSGCVASALSMIRKPK